MLKARLTIELVPKTTWFSNVRSWASKEDWDILRRSSYKKANYKCEICGGVGENHPVECHEIWQYDDNSYIQKLLGLISLCPACHEVKHIGLAFSRSRAVVARDHLAEVNGWSKQEADKYIAAQFVVWVKRNTHVWQLDLTWLDERNVKYK